MRILTTISLLTIVFCVSSYGQKKLTIKSDTTFNQTVLIQESTIIDGGNFKVTFNGNPKFIISNKSTLLLKNMKLADAKNWGSVNCGCIEWKFESMKGHFDDAIKGLCSFKCSSTVYLDGSPKPQFGTSK